MFRQVAPAPSSPPLGGSDGNSAVRFTPAVKYGGRENKLSRRETRCIRYHPSRAHHKLKWARTEQSGLEVLYKHVPRSESDKDSTQFAHGLSKGVPLPYQRTYRKTAHQKWMAQEKVLPSRNRPLARSARRYKGVIGESKEGIGGTRNPPCPPWPPEAPKINGKIKDYHLRNPNARKNRKPDPRRI